jgi:hypothetical protein
MQTIERRKTNRVGLRWHLRLSGAAIRPIQTRTENISSQGFYFILEHPLIPGEALDCELAIPNYGSGGVTRSIVCKADVVRVESRGAESGFGVGCRMVDFTLARNRSFLKASASSP